LKHSQIFSPLNLKEGPEISPSQQSGSHLEINNFLNNYLNVSQFSKTCSADVDPTGYVAKMKKKTLV
jgi:hypothetical protein